LQSKSTDLFLRNALPRSDHESAVAIMKSVSRALPNFSKLIMSFMFPFLYTSPNIMTPAKA